MTKSDQISGEQGSVKPEETLTDIIRQVAYNRDEHESAAIRAAWNGAGIRWLVEMATSDVEQDQEIVQFALQQHGFDSVKEFVESFFAAGEPVMAARKDLADLDPEKLEIQSDAAFELQQPGGGDDGG